jgi:hypothetical protein
MSNIIYNYQIFCTTECAWKHTSSVGENPPTACPLDGGHTVNLDSVFIESTTTPDYTHDKVLTPKKTDYNNDVYMRVYTYIYAVTSGTVLTNIKVLSNKDPAITSYDVKVTDITHNNILLTKNLTNTVEQVNDLGVLTNIPTTESIIEVCVKKNGGTKKDYVHVETIMFYFV